MTERPTSTRQAIKGVEDVPLKADLFAAASIFAEMCYSPELVKKFIEGGLPMESQLVKEWTAEAVKEAEIRAEEKAAEAVKEVEKRAAEERKEAEKRAAKEAEIRTAYITLQFNTLELLEVKFASVPEKVKDKLLKIQDVDNLKALFKNAIKVETFEAFEDYLEKF